MSNRKNNDESVIFVPRQRLKKPKTSSRLRRWCHLRKLRIGVKAETDGKMAAVRYLRAEAHRTWTAMTVAA
jgi:hypothetical protein